MRQQEARRGWRGQEEAQEGLTPFGTAIVARRDDPAHGEPPQRAIRSDRPGEKCPRSPVYGVSQATFPEVPEFLT